MINKSNKLSLILVSIFLFLLFYIVIGIFKNNYSLEEKNNIISKIFMNPDNTLHIISSFQNKDLEDNLKQYVLFKNYDIDIVYDSDINIIKRINNNEKFDAVWLSNDIWLKNLDDSKKISNVKYIYFNPIVFAIKKSDAEECGLINKKIGMKDILGLVNQNSYDIVITDPKTTNMGNSAYMSLLNAFIDSSENLSEENLEEIKNNNLIETLKNQLQIISNDDIEQKFLEDSFQIGFLYESMAIQINNKLEEKEKEILYLLYPYDGYLYSCSVLFCIKDEDYSKQDELKDLQTYFTHVNGRRKLGEQGKRFWFGGRYPYDDECSGVFKEEWGIKIKEYISSKEYPNPNIIDKALQILEGES